MSNKADATYYVQMPTDGTTKGYIHILGKYFSTYAIGYETLASGTETAPIAPEEQPSSGGFSNGNSSGSSSSSSAAASPYRSGEYAYWMGVQSQIEAAASGTTIVIDAGDYTRMPVSVMKALKAKTNVNLKISYNSGGNINIPSSLAPIPESDRVYYELDELAVVFPAGTAATATVAAGTTEKSETLAPVTEESVKEEAAPELEEAAVQEETSKEAAPEEEVLPAESGKQEEKEGCLWHWLTVLFMAVCVLFILIGEKKSLQMALLALGVDAVLTIIVMVLGSCSLDLPFGLVTLAIAGASIPVKRFLSREEGDE